MQFRWAAAALLALVPSTAAVAATLADQLVEQLRHGTAITTTEAQVEALAVLNGFYADRGMQPLWVGPGGATPRGRQIARFLADADKDGLDPGDYAAPAVAALLAARDADLLAELEVRLSLGLMQLVADLGQGRTTPAVADPELFVYRDEVDEARVIEAASLADDLPALIDEYRPQTDDYARLRATLAEYRALAAAGGWPSIPAGPSLEAGMSDPRVAMLRDRLRLWGDLSPGESSDAAAGDQAFFDDALAAAVRRMQERHGLEPDGIVGRNTLAALNVPVDGRIRQIILNLERLRWMPDDLGRRHIYVNLADYRLRYVADGKTEIESRVVIGEPYRRTPVFSSPMTYLVFNPDWTVPQSIARRLLLPQIKTDPGFLARNRYTLFSDWSPDATVVDPAAVDWSEVTSEGFSFKLRQEPGPGNALGRVKFMFPNPFSVYLHDTPAKELFSKAQRSFSNGCIRLEDPLQLAETILEEAEGWTSERIDATIAGGRPAVVRLPEPLPVHIGYLTAWVAADGPVQFRNDIYERDAALSNALALASVY